MICFVVDANTILATAFPSKTKQYLASAYKTIKTELNKRGFEIKSHVLDNEAPKIHTNVIEEENCIY